MNNRTWGRFPKRPFVGGYSFPELAWYQLNTWNRVYLGWFSASRWLS